MRYLKIMITLLVSCLCMEPRAKQSESSIDLQDNGNILSLGDLSFRVSSEKGGRIVSFKLGDKELLTTDSVDSRYYGASYWISPQSVYWPPYPNVDQWPYKLEIDGKKLRLLSQPDSIHGLFVTKEFSVSKKDTAILINYTVKNRSQLTKKLAPWDVVRVHGGLSFFPVGEISDINKSTIEDAYEEHGMIWFPFSENENEKGQKLFSTARGGWMAHYYKGLLFVKCFPDIDLDEIPPGQGEAEIYVAPKGRYLELESHGKYTELQSGRSLQYKQKWFLKDVGYKTKSELIAIIERLDKHID